MTSPKERLTAIPLRSTLSICLKRLLNMSDRSTEPGTPRSWLWGVIAATVALVALTFVGLATTSFGFAFLAGAPFVCGMVIGRWVQAARVVKVVWALVGIGSVIGGAVTANLAGLICGVAFGVVASAPLLAGVYVGSALAGTLRPGGSIASVVLVAILIPLEQATLPPAGVESVSTVQISAMTRNEVFSRITFYEDTTGVPPRLLRIALPRPVRTLGAAERVGDRPRCLYDGGFIVKEITAVDPGRLYEFRVVEQVGVEDHAVSLVGGSVQLDALDASRTKVVLTTTYRPKLSARIAWRPFERAVIHELHEHVLYEMLTPDESKSGA